jgi:hypothetical protein
MPHLSESQFVHRFVSLVLAGRDYPRRPEDQHILLLSAVLAFDPLKTYTEGEVNETLRRWVHRFGENLGLDHVTLRRYLVDAGYLQRDSAGSTYRARPEAGFYTFDASITALDLDLVLEEARQERARRKQAFMDKGGGKR